MTNQIDLNKSLLRAAKDGNLDGVVAALADGADIDYRVGQGWTAAMWAARGHHVEVLSYLAELGADLAIRDGLIQDCWDISAKNYLEDYSRSSDIRDIVRRNSQYAVRVAEMANEAKAFAKVLVKEFGGRSRRGGAVNNHSEYEVRTNFRGMQCQFQVFSGGFELWIQNYRIEDMIISLNIEHRDNKTHHEERDGQLAVEGWFSEDFPIYWFPTAESKAATRKFLSSQENCDDLRRLNCSRYEWMAMVPRQLRLRNQTTDMAIIKTRLDALANIFERASKKTLAPLVTQRYAMKYVRTNKGEAEHRFGGVAKKKIICPQCEGELCHIASFDATDARLSGIKWKRKSIVAAVCPTCSLYDVSSLTCINYSGRTPTVVYQSESSDGGETEEFGSCFIALSPIGNRAAEFKHRLGGEPGWIQGDATPDCPCCGKSMPFLAQFSSEDGLVIGADMGLAYVFLCSPCIVVAVAIQSY